MSTPRKYRFTISWDSESRVCDPDYSGSTRLTRPEGHVFHRKEWNGTIMMYREDFDTINDQTIETEFDLLVEWKDKDGYYQTEFEGYFTFTDIEWSPDRRTLGIKPIPKDEYKPFFDNGEVTYDLIELECPNTPIKFKRQPVVQVFFRKNYLGEVETHKEIVSVIGGNDYITEILPADPSIIELENDYHFAHLDSVGYIKPSGLVPDVSGKYIESGGILNYQFDREDGRYRVELKFMAGVGFRWQITDLTTSNAVYLAPADEPQLSTSPTYAEQGWFFTSESSPSQCRFYFVDAFARVLCNADTFNGSPTVNVPKDDIVEQQFNYKKVAPFPDAVILPYDGNQVAATSLGKIPDWALGGAGNYLTQPAGETVKLYSRKWTAVGWFFEYTQAVQDLLDPLEETITIKHAYHYRDVTRTLVDAMGADIGNISSGFFEDNNNAIRQNVGTPFLVPKSNIVIGDYDGPATKAPIRWADMNTLLRFYNAKWFITNEVLLYEHVDYFDRGKTYTGPNIGADLTLKVAPSHGEKWEYGQNNYRYEKQEIPDRIEFAWMDEVSEFFAGYPISASSIYVNKGQIDQVNLTPFTSDLDTVLLRDVSKEGFMLLECEEIDGEYYVRFLNWTDRGYTANVQNGHASLQFAHETYHRHRMPAVSCVLNGQDVTATTVNRAKRQTVEYPDNEFDSMELVRTGVGDGLAASVEKDLVTGMLKIELEHDTE